MMKPVSVRIAVVMTALSSLFAFTALGGSQEAPWLIVPGLQAGPILSTGGEGDLIRLYGKENVVSQQIYIDNEGMESEMGTILYPNDPSKKLSILWKDPANKRLLKRIDLFGDSSAWKIGGGISLGTSLKELERLNGREFVLWGFAWDAGGFVKTWNGGILEKTLSGKVHLGLDTIGRAKDPSKSLIPESVTEAEYFSVQGDRTFSSGHPVMQKLDPTVRRIMVLF